ncbi:MAG TPA: acyl-CoA dehydrogenase family protein, partial [Microthrixaceae bacterium]|nr:acyl-CoA dehydrogenase family protein [Microthrixaceae bacterium]
MTPEYPAETEAFRQSIRDFLAANLPEGWAGLGGLPVDDVLPFLEQWRKVLHEARLLAPQWPAEYGGGGLSNLETVIQCEEFAKVGAPTGGPNDVFNIGMIGNTILHW